MNKKTLRVIGVIFLLLFVSGVGIVSAQSRAELEDAYDYGYSMGRRDTTTNERNISAVANSAGLRYYPIRIPDTVQGKLRYEFVMGYLAGWRSNQ